jgi:hypothetical protein
VSVASIPPCVTIGRATSNAKSQLRFKRLVSSRIMGSGAALPDRLRQLAQELSQREFDVIVTAGPQPVRALIEAKVKPPIVFAITGDPSATDLSQVLRGLAEMSPDFRGGVCFGQIAECRWTCNDGVAVLKLNRKRLIALAAQHLE